MTETDSVLNEILTTLVNYKIIEDFVLMEQEGKLPEIAVQAIDSEDFLYIPLNKEEKDND